MIADFLLAQINLAVQEDDAEAVASLVRQLADIEPATAEIVRKVLFAAEVTE